MPNNDDQPGIPCAWEDLLDFDQDSDGDNEASLPEVANKKPEKSFGEKEKKRLARAEKKAQFAHEKNKLDKIFKTEGRVCQPVVVKSLKKWFTDNVARITDDMRSSFPDACNEIGERTTNMKCPSSHKLWKKAVRSSELDFDWAAWIVLRAVYYGPVAKSQKPEDIKFRANLLTNEAAKKTQERYPNTDIFTAQLPEDIHAPRPPEWEPLRKKKYKDEDTVEKKGTLPKPRRSTTAKKRKGVPEPSEEEPPEKEDQVNKRRRSNADQALRKALNEALNDGSGSAATIVDALARHVKKLIEDEYEIRPKNDDTHPQKPLQDEFEEWKKYFKSASAAFVRDKITEATSNFKQENKTLKEKIGALEEENRRLKSESE
ncbi:hypothetical protein NW768_010373 [Fusarium equiseti]|uniref:Uncharacterized protein n=1 Tax=Fusarium equiseti TaxID=61235 RepID=A0ABQ8R0Y7_FUSEQ|nr:hypothetical protein NW768_010373 [Fusarium equiseti]